MGYDIDLLARMPELGTLPRREAGLTVALRLWVAMRKLGRCPIGELAQRLGSRRAAAHLHLFSEEIGAAWPEPFCVAPLCCPRLSHDEAMVVDMLHFAAAGDQPGFDRLTKDLLPGDVRERLFHSARALADAMPAEA